MRERLPTRCVHCRAREPLDPDGFCLDYNACVERKPLAGSTRKGQRLQGWEPGMGPLVTKTGKVLTDDDIQALAVEAERGYDVTDTPAGDDGANNHTDNTHHHHDDDDGGSHDSVGPL